jgi:hypothetical protein
MSSKPEFNNNVKRRRNRVYANKPPQDDEHVVKQTKATNLKPVHPNTGAGRSTPKLIAQKKHVSDEESYGFLDFVEHFEF